MLIPLAIFPRSCWFIYGVDRTDQSLSVTNKIARSHTDIQLHVGLVQISVNHRNYKPTSYRPYLLRDKNGDSTRKTQTFPHHRVFNAPLRGTLGILLTWFRLLKKTRATALYIYQTVEKKFDDTFFLTHRHIPPTCGWTDGQTRTDRQKCHINIVREEKWYAECCCKKVLRYSPCLPYGVSTPLSHPNNKLVRPRWPYDIRPVSACRKVHVCHCNSLGGATWRWHR